MIFGRAKRAGNFSLAKKQKKKYCPVPSLRLSARDHGVLAGPDLCHHGREGWQCVLVCLGRDAIFALDLFAFDLVVPLPVVYLASLRKIRRGAAPVVHSQKTSSAYRVQSFPSTSALEHVTRQGAAKRPRYHKIRFAKWSQGDNKRKFNLQPRAPPCFISLC